MIVPWPEAGGYSLSGREKAVRPFLLCRSPRITTNLVLGGTGWANENGLNYHRYVGAELYGSVWRVGYYANIRDNYEDKVLSLPIFSI